MTQSMKRWLLTVALLATLLIATVDMGAADPVSVTVYATREGLVGETTANGHVIQPNDHFVALPSGEVLSGNGGREYEVRLTYNGQTVIAPV